MAAAPGHAAAEWPGRAVLPALGCRRGRLAAPTSVDRRRPCSWASPGRACI